MRSSILALAALAVPASAQTLVKDTQPPGPPPEVLDSGSAVAAGGVAYLHVLSDAEEAVLWRSDGTAAGTGALGHSGAGAFLPDGTLVGTATGFPRGLTRTDGTPEGAGLIREFGTGSDFVPNSSLEAFAGRVYFLLSDGDSHQLWSTGGTLEDTALVKAFDTVVEAWLVSGPYIYLTTGDVGPENNHQIWRCDGTAQGTILLDESPGYGPTFFAAGLNGGLLFAVNEFGGDGTLFFTDGSPGAPVTLPGPAFKELNPFDPYDSPVPGGVVVHDGYAYFRGGGLWRTDGTAAGTTFIQTGNPHPLGVAGGKVLYADVSPGGFELYVTDGTPTGSPWIKDIYPGVSSSLTETTQAVESAGILYFIANHPDFGQERWRSNGTSGGTFLLLDALPGTESGGYGAAVPFEGGLLFTAKVEGAGGPVIYRTNGTVAGTVLVRETYPLASASSGAPIELAAGIDRLFFSADSNFNLLWSSDGTPEGTEAVFDEPFGPHSIVQPAEIVPLSAGTFCYDAGFGSPGEPVVTDGVETTELGSDFYASGQGRAVRLGDRALCAAKDAAGAEPWITDGTPAGSHRLLDLWPGPGSSSPVHFHVHGARAYFSAFEPATGWEVYETDGTEDGTHLLGDLDPGSLDLPLAVYAVLDGVLHVWKGAGLWRIEAGSAVLASAMPSDVPRRMAAVGDRLLFAVGDTLYRYTEAAGVQGGPVFPRTLSRLAANGGRALFQLDGVAAGLPDELWSSDGTAAGTFRIDGVTPAFDARDQEAPAAVGTGGLLAFPASGASALGVEPWISDGSQAGTEQAADVWPGPASSNPRGFVRVGSQVFFSADDGQTGIELHALELPSTGAYAITPFGQGCPGTGGAVPTLGASGSAAAGDTLTLELAHALPLAPAIMLVGLDPAWLSVGYGCSLAFATPLVYLPLATGAGGEASLALPVPGSYVGLPVAFQFVVLDPGGAWFGAVSATNGLEVVVGP